MGERDLHAVLIVGKEAGAFDEEGLIFVPAGHLHEVASRKYRRFAAGHSNLRGKEEQVRNQAKRRKGLQEEEFRGNGREVGEDQMKQGVPRRGRVRGR